MADYHLLLDVGNTRLKCGLWQSGNVVPVLLPETEDPDLAGDLRSLAAQLDGAPSGVAMSCVRGVQAQDQIERWSQEQFAQQPLSAESSRQSCGLSNSYANPSTMGVDRWMAMIGAKARAAGAFCVADLGTATTLDAVDESGQHLGGLIAPGASLMVQAITQRAPGVFSDSSAKAMPWADNTQDAVYSGAAWGVADLVIGFQQRLQSHLSTPVPLFLCGGAAGDLLKLTPEVAGICHAPHLVLEGLGIWLNAHLET